MWFLGLAGLSVLLVFLVLPVEEWRKIGQWLHRSLRRRRWREDRTAGGEQVPVYESVRQQIKERVKVSPGPAAPPAPAPKRQRAAWSEVRVPFLLISVLFLGVGLFYTFFLQPRLFPQRPPRLTVVLTTPALGPEMTPWPEGKEAGRDLLDFLKEALDEAGLADTVGLELLNETPQDAATALELARQHKADMLLWGWVRPDDTPAYFFRLVIFPRLDKSLPEFEEYLYQMDTPSDLPLTRPGSEAGLSRSDLSEALIWLAHFYLGNYAYLEEHPPAAMGRAALSSETVLFHWASLNWLRGDYLSAQATYEGLLGPQVPPTACPPTMTPAFCAALANNRAVVLWTRESLGDLPPAYLDQARKLLEWAVEASPHNITAWYNLGRVALARERWEQAVEALEKTVRLNNAHVPALAALSEAYRQRGDLGDLGRAHERARAAVRVDAQNALAHLALARYHMAAGDFREAVRSLKRAEDLAMAEQSRRRTHETALKSRPVPDTRRIPYVEAWLRRIDPLQAQVHLAWAELYFSQARKEGLRPSPLVFVWRLIIEEPGPWTLALEEVGAALELHPNWYDALCLQGEIHLGREQFDEAVAAYEQARNQDAGYPRAYLGLAEVYRAKWRSLRDKPDRQGEAEQALSLAQAQYTQLIQNHIASARGYFGMGDLAWEAEQPQMARAYFIQAVEAYPNYAQAYLRLGQIDRLLGQFDSAMEFLDKAVETASARSIRVSAHIEKGEILVEQYLQGRLAGLPPAKATLEQAEQEFAAALEENPQAVRALSGRGRVAYEQEAFEQAQELLQQAFALDPYNFEAAYNLGRVYLALEKSGPALEQFTRAAEVHPESIASRFYLGQAAYAQNQEEKARQAFRKVQEMCETPPPYGLRPADDEESCQKYPAWLARGAASP